MLLKDMPIQRKLMRVIILISGVVLLVTCISFFVYEIYIFRKTTTEKLSTIGKIISANSTAALAFENADDAKETLSALKAEPHIVAAALYDKNGTLFSQYPSHLKPADFPIQLKPDGYGFVQSHLEGYEPVVQDASRLGTLYLKSDLGAMYERLRVLGVVTVFVMLLAILLAYRLTQILQKSISKPILALAETAKIISDQKDYSVRAIKIGEDELGSLTASFNDMLEQIESQNQVLTEFNQTLEQKVKDRTARLQSLNKELEAFSYSVSHDLRAPLRNVIGFATILGEEYSDKLDDEATRLITIIKSNTLKMGRLIDDLLAFSRMSRQDIVKTNIPSAAIVSEVIQELVVANSNGSIRWSVEDMPDVKGDMNAMRQVWTNLLSNAVKYSAKKEEPHIEVGCFREEDQTVFFVKDNGVGFDEKYKDKLFGVFQRLHNVKEFEGTGVGLAIVEKIISKHGGRVWAQAELNKGASFYFSIPG